MQRSQSYRWRAVALGTAAATVALTACSSSGNSGGSGGSSGASHGTLTIASSNPMSGDSGYYGQDKVHAIQLALSQINDAGGVNGRQVKLVVDDDAGDPAQGASLAAKECSNNDILAVIGHWNSSVSLAAAPIYDRCSLPNVNDDTTTKLSGISPYEFRVFATGAIEGAVLAQYAYAKGYRNVAVVNDTNDYGISLRDAFNSEFKKLGGDIVLSDSYIEGDKNFAPDADKIQSAQPDAVFIAGYYLETALLAKAIRSGGLTMPLLGGDGIDAPQLIQLGGSAVDGIVFADDYSADLQSSQNEAFVKAWSDKYNTAPDTFAALAYDTTNLILDAMKSGATSRSAIQKYLEQQTKFVGVTGPIKFDNKHDAARQVFLLTVSDGKITLNADQVVDGKIVSKSEVLK